MTRATISADSPLTAEAGARIARLGGNAVDIAVGAALAATVSEILMCSLGGGGFFMVRMPGQPAELFDGQDAFPAQMKTPDSESEAWRTVDIPYGDGIKIKAGYGSIAVPGLLAGAEATWRKHGSLPWKEIVAPALELASRPIPASKTMTDWVGMAGPNLLSQQPASRAVFFRGDKLLAAGDEYQVPNSQQTWEAISREGAAIFYQGDLAAAFADEILEHGGFVSREDLKNYRAIVRKPLSIESGGFQLALNPIPAVGGAAVGFLIRRIESRWRENMTRAEQAQLHAEAQSKLMEIRHQEMADPDLDDETAERLLQLTAVAGGPDSLRAPGTTHLSVATSDGAMVGVTMSMGYGSGIVIPGLGIACTNSLGEPELNPSGFHRGRPGSRLTSNMSPTLATHPDGRCLVLGSPGASRITTAIAQTWLHVVLDGKTYQAAVDEPRIHLEPFGDQLRAQYEPGIDPGLLKGQYEIRPFDSPSMYFGAVKLTGIDAEGNLIAVADARREGAVEFV